MTAHAGRYGGRTTQSVHRSMSASANAHARTSHIPIRIAPSFLCMCAAGKLRADVSNSSTRSRMQYSHFTASIDSANKVGPSCLAIAIQMSMPQPSHRFHCCSLRMQSHVPALAWGFCCLKWRPSYRSSCTNTLPATLQAAFCHHFSVLTRRLV